MNDLPHRPPIRPTIVTVAVRSPSSVPMTCYSLHAWGAGIAVELTARRRLIAADVGKVLPCTRACIIDALFGLAKGRGGLKAGRAVRPRADLFITQVAVGRDLVGGAQAILRDGRFLVGLCLLRGSDCRIRCGRWCGGVDSGLL